MNILIELPTWLGDTVMTTPAIQNLINTHKNAKITLFGSYVSIKTLKNFDNIVKTAQDNTKKSFFRLFAIWNISKKLGQYDIMISFRSSLYSKILCLFIKSKYKFCMKKSRSYHQVAKYNDFIAQSITKNFNIQDLKLNYKPFKYKNKTLGINPGATYGSAKRWYPKEFAKTAIFISKKYNYDIVIFGGSNEIDIATDIEKLIKDSGVTNYTNLAALTTIEDLISKIAGLDIFITNDSGPMHIAAAYKIKTFVIFGPTDENETDGWRNENQVIIKNDSIKCRPCKKKICPLKHHECMKLITSDMVINKIKKQNI